MKKLIFSLATVAALSLLAVTPVALRPGENKPPVGEIAALEAVTTNAAATVKVDYVVSVLAYTNALAQTIDAGRRYDFGLTNWNGVAYVATNSWKRFDFSDWTVNGTNHVVGPITSTNLVVTNTFPILVPGPVYVKTNSVFSATASGHYLMATNPAVRFFSGKGKLVVSGASADDSLTLFVK